MRLRLRGGAEVAQPCCSRVEDLARFFADAASFACRVDRGFATCGGDLVRFRTGGLNWRSAWGTSAGFVRVSATDAASAADRRTRCSLMRRQVTSLAARRAYDDEVCGAAALGFCVCSAWPRRRLPALLTRLTTEAEARTRSQSVSRASA